MSSFSCFFLGMTTGLLIPGFVMDSRLCHDVMIASLANVNTTLRLADALEFCPLKWTHCYCAVIGRQRCKRG